MVQNLPCVYCGSIGHGFKFQVSRPETRNALLREISPFFVRTAIRNEIGVHIPARQWGAFASMDAETF